MASAVADAGLQAVGPGTYAIEPRANAAFRVVNRLLAAGVPCGRVSKAVLAASPSLSAGAFVVTIKDAVQGRQLADVVAAEGVEAQRIDRLPRIAIPPVRAARIGLYKSWVANMDEGWTRWLFEQYAFPYTTITDADVRSGALRDRFDVIVLPDQAPRRIVSGHQPTDRPREGPWGPVPLAVSGRDRRGRGRAR